MSAYNAASGNTGVPAGAPDPAGKPADLIRAQDQPPYSLIDISIRRRPLYPAPVLTLGGLVTDPGTGQVLRADGTAVPGLYAAGRSAVGLCSRSYVSGLSIADCVFSGRRAGRNAAKSCLTSALWGLAGPPLAAWLWQPGAYNRLVATTTRALSAWYPHF